MECVREARRWRRRVRGAAGESEQVKAEGTRGTEKNGK